MTLTFDLSVHPFPCSPVNLVSPTRFRFVYALIFGAISSTLLGLVFSSRGVTVIKVDTHYLDIFVNTSEFSVDWRIHPPLHSKTSPILNLFLFPFPHPFLPLFFLFPSFLPLFPSLSSPLTSSCESSPYNTGAPVFILPPFCLCGHSLSSDRTHHWSLVHMHSVSYSIPC